MCSSASLLASKPRVGGQFSDRDRLVDTGVSVGSPALWSILAGGTINRFPFFKETAETAAAKGAEREYSYPSPR